MGVIDAIEWVCVLCGHLFKMTQQVEQWIYIRFCVKLEHSPMETIWMIQKATAMDKWWLAASSWQHQTHVSPHMGTSNHPGDSAPLQTRFGALQLLAFPQNKVTFERAETSDHQWVSGKYNSIFLKKYDEIKWADGDWENWVRSQGPCFKGDWEVLYLLQ